MRRALHAEWTKLRTVPGPAWLALAAIALTIMVSAIISATVTFHPVSGHDPVPLALTGIDVGQATVATLAVGVIASEYATGMIHTTLIAMPRRLTVLAAKAVLTTGVVVAVAVPSVLGSLFAGRLLLPGRGFTAAHGYATVTLSDGTILRAAVGSILYLSLIALLSLGIATAVRDTAVATGLVLGLLYFFPLLAAAVSDATWHRHLEQIGPMSAGQLIEATTNLPTLPLSPWQGLGVLASWAAGALLVGGTLLKLRDA